MQQQAHNTWGEIKKGQHDTVPFNDVWKVILVIDNCDCAHTHEIPSIQAISYSCSKCKCIILYKCIAYKHWQLHTARDYYLERTLIENIIV